MAKTNKTFKLCRKVTYLEYVTVTATGLAEAKRRADMKPPATSERSRTHWQVLGKPIVCGADLPD